MCRVVKTVVVMFAILTLLGLMSRWEHTYTREATVIDKEGIKVYTVDKQGNEWNYTVSKDDKTKQGDTVILTMHDNTTSGVIVDDKVIRAKVKA